MTQLVPLPKSLPPALLDYLPTSMDSPASSPSLSPSRRSSSHRRSPNHHSNRRSSRPGPGLPFVTLTYATSLDSRISAAPGAHSVISHPETQTMTHYLRYHHDAVLVGVGTVLADDPSLNCRWTPASDEASFRASKSEQISSLINIKSPSLSPTNPTTTPTIMSRDPHKNHFIQPIIVDPSFRWDPRESRLIQLADKGLGLAPYVVVRQESFSEVINDPDTRDRILALEQAGGKIISIPGHESDPEQINEDQEDTLLCWDAIFRALYKETTGTGAPIRSLMVEGGATVINSLLDQVSSNIDSKGPPPLVSSIVVTVGPVFLGSKGVSVSPATSQPRINHVRWWTGSRDAVLFASLY